MSYNCVQEFISDRPFALITWKSVMHGESKTIWWKYWVFRNFKLPCYLATNLLFLLVCWGVVTRTEPTICQMAPMLGGWLAGTAVKESNFCNVWTQWKTTESCTIVLTYGRTKVMSDSRLALVIQNWAWNIMNSTDAWQLLISLS